MRILVPGNDVVRDREPQVGVRGKKRLIQKKERLIQKKMDYEEGSRILGLGLGLGLQLGLGGGGFGFSFLFEALLLVLGSAPASFFVRKNKNDGAQ